MFSYILWFMIAVGIFSLGLVSVYFMNTEESFKNTEFVTVKFTGGLGNQLFQIAAAYAYGKKYNKSLIMDHTQQMSDHHRKTYFGTITKWVPNDPSVNQKNWQEIEEKDFKYIHLEPLPGNVRLRGDFQSLKYFEKYEKELVKFFTENIPPIPSTHPTLLAIRKSVNPTVSMHIRRTDYVGTAKHIVQPIEYYRNALGGIQEKLGKKMLTIIVFSDDMPWCKQNLQNAFPGLELVFTDSTGVSDIQELILMSECQHHIIANSSFSWWGAMFDQKPGKIVVAPKNWFGPGFFESWQHVYCPGWIVV